MKKANSGKARLLILLLAVTALSVAAVACGSSGGGSSSDGPIAKIAATERVYTIQDFIDAGFKKA